MTELEKARNELAKARFKEEALRHQLTLKQNIVSRELRKVRTKKLIREGAELEAVFPKLKGLSIEDSTGFIKDLSKFPNVKELYEKLPDYDLIGGDD